MEIDVEFFQILKFLFEITGSITHTVSYQITAFFMENSLGMVCSMFDRQILGVSAFGPP